MIELVLVFLLGMLSAGLLWLLLLPAVWHRAQRLTRERVERALPLDVNEILAERDRERAAYGVQQVAFDERIDHIRAETLAAKAELGSHIALEARLMDELAQARNALKEREARIGGLEGELAARDESLSQLNALRTDDHQVITRHEQARAILEAHLADARAQVETERRARDEAEVLARNAREAEEEERARAISLRAELQARAHAAREQETREQAAPEQARQHAV